MSGLSDMFAQLTAIVARTFGFPSAEELRREEQRHKQILDLQRELNQLQFQRFIEAERAARKARLAPLQLEHRPPVKHYQQITARHAARARQALKYRPN
jgi:hypothetical protein